LSVLTNPSTISVSSHAANPGKGDFGYPFTPGVCSRHADVAG